MFKQLIAVPVVALCVGVGMTAAQSTTQSPQQVGETYLWHGELVSFDEGTKVLTVKAPVLAETEKEIARFKAGERILLTGREPIGMRVLSAPWRVPPPHRRSRSRSRSSPNSRRRASKEVLSR